MSSISEKKDDSKTALFHFTCKKGTKNVHWTSTLARNQSKLRASKKLLIKQILLKIWKSNINHVYTIHPWKPIMPTERRKLIWKKVFGVFQQLFMKSKSSRNRKSTINCGYSWNHRYHPEKIIDYDVDWKCMLPFRSTKCRFLDGG